MRMPQADHSRRKTSADLGHVVAPTFRPAWHRWMHGRTATRRTLGPTRAPLTAHCWRDTFPVAGDLQRHAPAGAPPALLRRGRAPGDSGPAREPTSGGTANAYNSATAGPARCGPGRC